MRLDSAALKALNVFPLSTDGNKSMNLFGLLNKGRTAAGHRLLAQWLRQPLLDLDKIGARGPRSLCTHFRQRTAVQSGVSTW
jgi:DNA mismatch repair protein MSH2